MEDRCLYRKAVSGCRDKKMFETRILNSETQLPMYNFSRTSRGSRMFRYCITNYPARSNWRNPATWLKRSSKCKTWCELSELLATPGQSVIRYTHFSCPSTIECPNLSEEHVPHTTKLFKTIRILFNFKDSNTNTVYSNFNLKFQSEVYYNQ